MTPIGVCLQYLVYVLDRIRVWPHGALLVWSVALVAYLPMQPAEADLVPKSPCSTIATPLTVNLGNYSTAMFSNPGYSPWVPFTVQMNNCYDLTSALFTFTYQDPNSFDLITNTGSAGGVAVELYNFGNTETVIKNNVAFSPTMVSTGTSSTFSLQARMKKAPGSVPQAGSVQASATLTVTYP